MNYGLYTSASGVLTSMYRQDVMSNNLANVETVGYKPDSVATRQRDPVRIEDSLLNLPSNAMLERLGAGVLLSPNRVSLTQGSLEQTGDPMNIAIQGDGFLVVETGAGPDGLRLTRDGRLARRADGRLVHTASGGAVLDESNRPITLGPAPFTIDRDGTIRQAGGVVATLRLAGVADPSSIEKAGTNLLKTTAAPAGRGTGEFAQGHLERSASDPIDAIMGITNAANAVQNNARMIQLFDELMGRTINQFARVA